MSKENLIGQKFNRLTVLEFAYIKEVGKSHSKRRYWKCLCDCGNIIYVDTGHLKNGATKSCGCLHADRMREEKFIDLTGKKFGRLTVIKEYKNINNKRIKWECKCDCGNIVITTGDSLTTKKTTSCGCKRKETRFLQRKRNIYKFDKNEQIGFGYDEKGNYFIFDLEDYDKIKDYTWRKSNDGHWNYRNGNNTLQLSHIILPEIPKYQIIDHKDKNPDNNRKNNLRPANKQTNAQNSKISKKNTSGVIGVCKTSSNKWRAYLTINKKQIGLGIYEKFEDAVKARLKGERKYFKEFAPQQHLFKEYEI